MKYIGVCSDITRSFFLKSWPQIYTGIYDPWFCKHRDYCELDLKEKKSWKLLFHNSHGARWLTKQFFQICIAYKDFWNVASDVSIMSDNGFLRKCQNIEVWSQILELQQSILSMLFSVHIQIFNGYWLQTFKYWRLLSSKALVIFSKKRMDNAVLIFWKL